MRHNKILQELQVIEKNLRIWENLQGNENFKALVKWLEYQYTEIGSEDCRSVADVKARNKALGLIRDFFRFMRYDFDAKNQLLAELRQTMNEDGELPDGEPLSAE